MDSPETIQLQALSRQLNDRQMNLEGAHPAVEMETVKEIVDSTAPVSSPPPTETEELVKMLPSKALEDVIVKIVGSDSFSERKNRRRPGYSTIHLKNREMMNPSTESTQEVIRNMDSDVISNEKNPKTTTSPEMKKKRKHDFFILWSHHLKTIEGHFGSSVASYFLFIRALVFLNVPVFLLSFAFVVVPQILFRWFQQNPRGYLQNVSFTGEELLTGWGWFEETELYYGYYTNHVINMTGAQYDMKYAFICSSIGHYVLVLIILLYMLSGAYKKSYVQASDVFKTSFAGMVFSSWDYGIMSKEMKDLKQKRILTDMMELLAEAKLGDNEKTSNASTEDNTDAKTVNQNTEDKSDKKMNENLPIYPNSLIWPIRLLINVVILGMIAASVYLMWYLTVNKSYQNYKETFIKQLTIPLCISALNHVVPSFFAIIIQLEYYSSPKAELYITMVRTVLLNFSTLAVLVYSWFVMQKSECWETVLGAQLYSLVVIDFIFILITTFLMEFALRIFLWPKKNMDKKPFQNAKDNTDANAEEIFDTNEEENVDENSETTNENFRFGKPEFSVGRNSLNIVYSQTLVWLGVYYSPMLSFIMIIKLIIIFYVKKVNIMWNCRPPSKVWRARETPTVLFFIIFISFILSVVTFICSVFTIRPSGFCGPFRNYNHTYEVLSSLTDAVDEKSGVLNFIVDFLTSATFLAFVTVILLVVAYFSHLVASGHYEVAELLKKQLELEEDDKTFLMNLLRNNNGNNNAKPLEKSSITDDSRQRSFAYGCNGMQPSTSDVIDLEVASESSHKPSAYSETRNPIFDPTPPSPSGVPRRRAAPYDQFMPTP